MIHELLITPTEKKVLEAALEFYIRLGLGQLGDIGTRFRLLTGRRDVNLEPLQHALDAAEEQLQVKPWRMEDRETSLHTVLAFGIQAKMQGDYAGGEWAAKRYHELEGLDKV